MRAIFATLFLITLSTTLAIKTEVRQTMMKSAGFQYPTDSKLGSALSGLLQVAQLSETQEVIDIITQVRDELAGLLHETEQNYEVERGNYESAKTGYLDTISSLEQQINEVDGALSEAKTSRDELEAAIQGALDTINTAQRDLETENGRRDTVRQQNSAKIADLSDAISACNDALSLLAEVRGKDLGSGAVSLLQTNSQKIQITLKKVNNKIQGMKFKSNVSPIMKTLLEVVAAGVNEGMIDQIVTLITELRDSLIGEVASTSDADAADQTYHETTVGILQGTIDGQTESVNTNNAILTGVRAQITSYEETLTTLHGGVDAARENLRLLNEEWRTKSGAYDAQLERIRRDIEVLGQALDYLNLQQ